ncbi:MAG: hypothetical protein JWM41_4774 [Gemmatimonadetes bacterium]|nr:hypothetical protein [Gemmatimonadota bacterium]
MMIDLGLSTRDRRTLVIGLASIATLGLVARGVPAFRTWESTRRAEAAALADRLATARRSARALPALRDSLRARRSRITLLDSTLISAASSSAAAAALASVVEDLADDAPIRVSALQLRADSVTRAGLATVTVRVTGVADVIGLAAFLRAVDGGEHHTSVRELAISQPDPAAPDSKPEMLRIDALIETVALIRQGLVK